VSTALEDAERAERLAGRGGEAAERQLDAGQQRALAVVGVLRLEGGHQLVQVLRGVADAGGDDLAGQQDEAAGVAADGVDQRLDLRVAVARVGRVRHQVPLAQDATTRRSRRGGPAGRSSRGSARTARAAPRGS
jgi:hypothetical protein